MTLSCKTKCPQALVIALFLLLPLAAQDPGPRLEGLVLDPAKASIEGAKVEIVAENGVRPASLRTSSDGRFATAVAPGAYSILVSADGFQTGKRRVEVRGGSSYVEISLQLNASRETITIFDSAGYQVPVAAALKSPTQLLNVPQAVSVVGRGQIQDQSMQNMADVVRFIPGITMAQGEGHRDAPVIRGNATTADFYVNGVRDDVQYLRDLYNVERVEAVKGANALTFGRGGGGGVINRVTKQAEYVPVRELALQGGSFVNRRVSADASQPINQRLALRLNGVYENSGSFRDSVSLERYGIAPALSLKLNDRTLIRTSYEFFNDGRTVDRGIPSFGGGPVSTGRSVFFGSSKESFADAAVHIGSVAMEHQAGAWTLRNTLMAAGYDKFYQNILPGAVNASRTLVNLSGYNNATGRRNLFNQSDVSGVIRTGPFRHTILAGGELGRQSTENFRNTAYFNGSATSLSVPFGSPDVLTGANFRQSASDANNSARNLVAAAFVQDQVEITRFVQLVAGVRVDKFTIDFNDHRTAQHLKRSDNLAAPRLGVVLKPVANVSVYGSYSVTYLPSAGDQFSSLTATTQTLRPERFNNWETGAKVDLARGLSVTAALYRLDRNNSTARDPNNPAITVQTGSQRTNGFETAINGTISRRWQIAGGYATQDAFVRRATAAAAVGSKVAIVPGHTFSLWNNYNLISRLSVGIGVIHQSAMWAGIDNTVRLPSFTRGDGAVFYNLNERLRLQANIENVLNLTYYPTAHSNNNILPGSPRAARLGLVARF
jgi:catecholate siderophore receptor